jgi:hypothetical protein
MRVCALSDNVLQSCSVCYVIPIDYFSMGCHLLVIVQSPWELFVCWKLQLKLYLQILWIPQHFVGIHFISLKLTTPWSYCWVYVNMSEEFLRFSSLFFLHFISRVRNFHNSTLQHDIASRMSICFALSWITCFYGVLIISSIYQVN